MRFNETQPPYFRQSHGFLATISGGWPGGNHCHHPHRMPAPYPDNLKNKIDFWSQNRGWLTRCNTLSTNTRWGGVKRCCWTGYSSATQSRPQSEEVDLAPTLSCRLNCNSQNCKKNNYMLYLLVRCTCLFFFSVRISLQAGGERLLRGPHRQSSPPPPQTRDGQSPSYC